MGQDNISFVSSFGIKDWDIYPKKFIESFIENCDESVSITLYYDGGVLPEDAPKAKNVFYKNLDFLIDLKDFKENNKQFNGMMQDGSYNYRMDAIKFSHKVFAMIDKSRELAFGNGHLVWLDADCIVHKKFSLEEMKRFVIPAEDIDISHLGRTAIDYSETGWISFNLNSERTLEFLHDYNGMYISNEMFGYREWHDGFIFTRLLNIHEEHGLKVHNLSPTCKDLNAFEAAGLTEFVNHNKGELKNFTIPQPKDGELSNKVPIKIRPHDCMPDDYIQKSIEANKKKMDKWLKERGRINNEHVIIASAGPSLEKRIDELKSIKRNKKAKVVCVKHSLPILLKHKIIPDACVILDPRPLNGESTHGIVRKDLYKKLPKKTKFFIASMTDEETVDYILSKTDNVYGWDALSQAVQNWEGIKDDLLITGGTCAALRAMGVYHTLGFRNFHFFGFDSSIEGEPEDKEELLEDGNRKWFKVCVGDNEQKHWVTGELLAMAQDIEQTLDHKTLEINLEIYGGGLVEDIWNNRLNDGYRKKDYKEILGD